MAQTVGVEKTAAGRGAGGAWGICWLMFACTVLNYMSRQAMAVVGPQVRADFGLDMVGYGWVLASFQLTYAFFQWPAGYLVDRWDVRKTYAGAVVWWSLAGLATAFTPVLGLLFLCRALLGVGESFNWPCGLRVTAGVLPPSDRGLGNGIFNSGAAVGAVLTPLLIVPLAVRYGWQAPFVLLGLAGLVWVAAWLLLTRGRTLTVATQGAVAGAEAARGGLAVGARLAFSAVAGLALLTAAGYVWFGMPALWWGVAVLMIGPLVVARLAPREDLAGADWARSLGDVVRRRRFWIMAAVGITINVSWHFLVNWMTSFFQVDLKLGLLIGGMVTAVPFLAADAGNLGGGWLARRLARAGLAPAAGARSFSCCACC